MKICDENLFSENAGLGSKSYNKWYLLMMSCKTARNKETGRLAVSCIFYEKYLQNLKYNVPLWNTCMYISLNFVCDSIQLGFVH